MSHDSTGGTPFTPLNLLERHLHLIGYPHARKQQLVPPAARGGNALSHVGSPWPKRCELSIEYQHPPFNAPQRHHCRREYHDGGEARGGVAPGHSTACLPWECSRGGRDEGGLASVRSVGV